jgi:signal transduction histidine kinase
MDPIDLGSPERGTRMGTATFAFVLLTLAALVGVPVLVQGRVTALRQEIAASEPARTLIRRLQLNLVRAVLVQNERGVVPTDTLAAAYASLRSQERALLGELRPIARELGPAVVNRLDEVEQIAGNWHERVAVEVPRRRAEGANLLDDPAERQSVETVLRSLATMDSTILDLTADARARIGSAERMGLRLTGLLGLLALAVAVAVAVLWSRTRHYAAEAERRRGEAEVQRETAVRRRRETEEALAAAARANEARARLLRGVSHDVKNPLGAAKGYAELLAMGVKGPLQPEQESLVQGVQRSVDGALAILADLLDLARTESGGLQIRRVETDLAGVASGAVEDHRAAAEAAGHSLTFERPPEPIPIHTDPERTSQVLGNLLSNAIKYTPAPGRITVRADLSDATDIGKLGIWPTVRVTDDGPGVPADESESIFQEFTRLDDRGGPAGHGLGLAIARRIARLMGGDLTLDPSSSPGASFVLWLPRREGQSGAEVDEETTAADRSA